jgi:osmotically-inducible protein OsmY
MAARTPISVCCAVALVVCGCGGHGRSAAAGAQAGAAPTAQEQSATADDLAITKRVRQSVMADERLSLAAKNVTIITVAGKVTLRGTVPAAREKAEIGIRAREIAGIDRVDNLVVVGASPRP